MRAILAAAALCAVVSSVAYAQTAAGIVVSDAWARPSAGPSLPSAAYFTITDHGPADRLTSVRSPLAGRSELHETREENGVMKMRAVGALPLPTGTPVKLAPGGYHVMLMELKQPLKAGDKFPLTLTFESAPPQTIQVTVAASAAGGHGGMQMDHGGMQMGGSKP